MRILLLTFLTLHAVIGTGKYQLKFVQIFWRHGDRAPWVNYPTNPNVKYWKQGFGQLTQLGMRQHYELGKYFSQRYKEFISPHYYKKQIVTHAGKEDRLIESALADMAGWFPPTDWQVFEKGLPWQPIPIHITNASNQMIEFNRFTCPRWNEINLKVENETDYLAMIKEAQPMTEYMSKYMGVKVTFTTNLYQFADLFMCDKIHNLTFPKWFSEGVDYNQLQFYGKYYTFRMFDTLEEQILCSASILYYIRENFVNFTKGQPTLADKIMILSGHDTNIMPMMKVLGIFNERMIPYAAALLFELYEDQFSNEYIKISYKNETERDPYLMKMPSCGLQEYCPIETFLQFTEDKVYSYKVQEAKCQI